MPPLASDNFTRANENPLNPANWTVPTGATALQVVSNACEPAVISGGSSIEVYTGIAWPNDHYSECVINAIANSGVALGPIARAATGSLNFYYTQALGGSLGGFTRLAQYVVVNGGAQQLGSFVWMKVNAGDTLRIECVGQLILSKLNGNIIIANYDNTLASGSAGLWLQADATLADTIAGPWDGGAASAPAALPFSYTLVNDSFSRANAATLGTRWTAMSDSFNTGTIGITSTTASPQTTGVNCGSFYVPQTFQNDQWGLVTVGITGTPSTTTGGGIVLRASTANGGNYYRAFLNYGNLASVFLNCGKLVAGSFSAIGASVNLGALAVGAILYVEMVGSTFNVYVNGTLQLTATDSSLLAGSPGVCGFNQSGSQLVAMSNWRAGDFIWNRHVNVIAVNQAHTTGNGNQEPAVIYEGNPQILSGNVFKMWHTDGWVSPVPVVDYAESNDGISWTELTANPAISNGVTAVIHGITVKLGSTYYAYMGNNATANASFDQWTSPDGKTWTLAHAGVLVATGTGTEVGVNNPFVWIEGSTWFMLYDGNTTGNAQYNLRLATSLDGITWAKYAGNPVITLGSGSISSADMHKIGGVYYVFLHGAPSGNLPSDVYLYSSTDLHTWYGATQNPVVFRLTNDEGPDVPGAGQLADAASVEVAGTTYLFNDATRVQASGNFHINMRSTGRPLANILSSSMGFVGPLPNLGSGGDLGPGYDFRIKL